MARIIYPLARLIPNVGRHLCALERGFLGENGILMISARSDNVVPLIRFH